MEIKKNPYKNAEYNSNFNQININTNSNLNFLNKNKDLIFKIFPNYHTIENLVKNLSQNLIKKIILIEVKKINDKYYSFKLKLKGSISYNIFTNFEIRNFKNSKENTIDNIKFEENKTCSICFDYLKINIFSIKFNCNHILHYNCFKYYNEDYCPICLQYILPYPSYKCDKCNNNCRIWKCLFCNFNGCGGNSPLTGHINKHYLKYNHHIFKMITYSEKDLHIYDMHNKIFINKLIIENKKFIGVYVKNNNYNESKYEKNKLKKLIKKNKLYKNKISNINIRIQKDIKYKNKILAAKKIYLLKLDTKNDNINTDILCFKNKYNILKNDNYNKSEIYNDLKYKNDLFKKNNIKYIIMSLRDKIKNLVKNIKNERMVRYFSFRRFNYY